MGPEWAVQGPLNVGPRHIVRGSSQSHRGVPPLRGQTWVQWAPAPSEMCSQDSMEGLTAELLLPQTVPGGPALGSPSKMARALASSEAADLHRGSASPSSGTLPRLPDSLTRRVTLAASGSGSEGPMKPAVKADAGLSPSGCVVLEGWVESPTRSDCGLSPHRVLGTQRYAHALIWQTFSEQEVWKKHTA